MFRSASIENQKFYLNNNFISGIQSLNLSYDTNISPSFAINDTGMNYNIGQGIIANFSLSYIPGDYEPFIQYTGSSFFTGKIEYANKYINFSSGCIDNYSISSQLDSPVEVSVQGKVLGLLAYNTGLNASSGSLNYGINPINYCYIDINLNSVNLNRLNTYSLSLASPKIPSYTIGEFLPTEIVQQYPIEITSNLNFEISEEVIENYTGLFNNPYPQDILVNFRNINNNSNVLSFNLNKFIVENKNFNFAVNENGTYNVSYKGYINS